MLWINRRFILRWSLVVVCHFVLLLTEPSGSIPGERALSRSPDPEDARLVEGGGLCSGRLEMRHEREWRVLIPKYREYKVIGNYAQVACRQMGCGSLVSIKQIINETNQRRAWEADFSCHGTEATLKECQKRQTRRSVQGRPSSPSSLQVVCSESVRFHAANICWGSVEVRSDQGWVSVCEDGFDSNAKNVVCREMGCGPPGWSFSSSSKKEVTVLSKEFHCRGNESRLEDCTASVRTDCRAASVVSCSDNNVRLVGGGNPCEGNLEGKLDGEWRILSDRWSINSQHIPEVCMMLGCGNLISSSSQRLPKRHPSWAISNSCDRGGSSFCRQWEESGSTEVITLTCSEAVRLVEGTDRCSGELKVKSGQSWLSVCDSFSSEDALVTCRDLECGFPDAHHGRPRENDQQQFQHSDLVLKCQGEEKHLMDCPSTMVNVTTKDFRQCHYAYVACIKHPRQPSMSVYTQNQESNHKNVYKGHRFAISCKSNTPYKILSFRLRSGVPSKKVEQIQSPVDGEAVFMFPAAEDAHQENYHCDYNLNFSSKVFSTIKSIFITVQEQKDVRLVRNSSRCAGSLEVKHQAKWRPVSYMHTWSLKEAAVVCRQLNCGSAVSSSKASNSAELLPAWRFFSDCDGSDKALMDCGTVMEWMSTSTVDVVCSGVLLPPNIFVYSMEEQLDDEEQQGHVTVVSKGHSFSISCSVEPQYPGGFFTVIFTDHNPTLSRTQPAVKHSAHFTYTAVDTTRSGNYSCVYHNLISNQNFSSESQSHSIIVREKNYMFLDDGVPTEDDRITCAGKLVIGHKGKWTLLSAESSVWDLRHASVVCRQLGCGSAVSTKEILLPHKQRIFRFFSDCDGSESALLDCGTLKLWYSSSAVEVVCTGAM